MSQTTEARGTIEIPEADHVIQPTSRDDLDKAIETVRSAKDAWVAQDVVTRMTLLEELMSSTRANAARACMVASPHGFHCDRPRRQSSRAACIASQAGTGGNP
jgi:acyl-CoA reductase-like NAD-dependent aldehyde dehydrogenase